MGRGALTGGVIGGALGGATVGGAGKLMNSKASLAHRTDLYNSINEIPGGVKQMYKAANMPTAAPAPVGRPPLRAKPRTPSLATGAAQNALSPITTKVATRN